MVQQNVGKNKAGLQAVAMIASRRGIDVLMYQEPLHHGAGAALQRLPNVPGYKKFSPIQTWRGSGNEPRVVTYVKKSLPAIQLQSPCPDNRDLLLVKVKGMQYLNVYRDPKDDPDTWEHIQGWPAPSKCTIVGDFNAIDPLWDPRSKGSKRKGADITEWMLKNGLELISEAGVVTHQRGDQNGTIIDLAFSTNPGKAEVLLEAGIPGEHHALEGFVRIEAAIDNEASKLERFKLPEDEEALGRIKKEVKEEVDLIPVPVQDATAPLSREALDAWARALVDALGGAIIRNGKRCQGTAGNRKS
jgi:hypothetical protein